MLLPTTHSAALLLLLLSFVCLGSWPNLLKAGGGRWRFELFYIDFALGALFCALVAAYTLGTLGSELSFNDRIAVAGLRSQALAIGGGFVFSLGNMLLLASASLLGLAAAFALTFSLALIVWSCATPHGSIVYLIAGVILLLLAAVAAAVSRREAAVRKQTSKRPSNVGPPPVKRSSKGTIAGVIGGTLIGISYPVADGAFWGDLGLGAYAGLLMFCTGVIISTAIFSLFFMNIAIEGPRLSFRSYLSGTMVNHVSGWAGGLLWAGGVLLWLLAQSVPPTEQPSFASGTLWTQGAALLTMLWGFTVWGEYRGSASKSKTAILLAAVAFAGGLVALAYRIKS